MQVKNATKVDDLGDLGKLDDLAKLDDVKNLDAAKAYKIKYSKNSWSSRSISLKIYSY